MRTFKTKGYLTKHGHAELDRVLRMNCGLYNAALEERVSHYKHWRLYHKPGDENQKKSISFFDQSVQFKEVRAGDEEWRNLSVVVARGTLQRVHKTYQNFFRSFAKGGGFPRFKPWRRFRTLELNDVHKGMLKGEGAKRSLKIKGLPCIRIKAKRELPPVEQLKAIRITRTPVRVSVSLVFAAPPPTTSANSAAELPAVGIDFGLKTRMALVDNAQKCTFVTPRITDKRLAKVRRLQRQMHSGRSRRGKRGKGGKQGAIIQRAQPGSKGYAKRREQKARLQQRIADAARNEAHRTARALVNRFGFIAAEALRIRNMVRRRKTGRGFGKAILEQRWGLLRQLIREKAGSAGCVYVEVEPAHTSQTCSGCGKRKAMPLQERKYECAACGLVLDRDENAARNMLERGLREYAKTAAGRDGGGNVPIPGVDPAKNQWAVSAFPPLAREAKPMSTEKFVQTHLFP